MTTNSKIIGLEKRIVDLIVERLKTKEISLERDQEIANFILKSLPEDSANEEPNKIVPDDTYPELAPVVLIDRYLTKDFQRREGD